MKPYLLSIRRLIPLSMGDSFVNGGKESTTAHSLAMTKCMGFRGFLVYRELAVCGGTYLLLTYDWNGRFKQYVLAASAPF